MKRAYYSNTIASFHASSPEDIVGKLTINSEFPVETTQRDAWLAQISLLHTSLKDYQGTLYFEYSIPRMGHRIDAVLLIGPVIFVIEFKIGEKEYTTHAIDQAWDYALDLKNFHETSHNVYVAPVLVATNAENLPYEVGTTAHNDKLLFPIMSNGEELDKIIQNVLNFAEGAEIDQTQWEAGRYCPTPTIVEAAKALYNGHSVSDISRSDAGAINLHQTSDAVAEIISYSRSNNLKSVCFVTGVPGAGKTLVGLNIANTHIDKSNDLYSVYLSGNGPLVAILREALARDRVKRSREKGLRIKKGEAMSEVKMFIQNVHHFRDDCLVDEKPPIEHVALFDEAQRAWNKEMTTNFMHRKKKRPNFNISEPEFLLSCLDRHPDWAVVVCLVGGGQEINTGEAGISEWIEALQRAFPKWHLYISPKLTDSEYGSGRVLEEISLRINVTYKDELHLAVSMRSFRAEHVSRLVKEILDRNIEAARQTLAQVSKQYPMVITRDLVKAKKWLKEKARGSERYGVVVSSHAERLKPHAIDVKSPMDPIHWFLDGKEDVRSSYYLEDVATEFHIQGLELDWACVTWDADFRYSDDGWGNWSFRGDKWQRIKKEERKKYQKNAYRVLLTRARQGMVIVVPQGDTEDPTRDPEFYDSTYAYLQAIGMEEL